MHEQVLTKPYREGKIEIAKGNQLHGKARGTGIRTQQEGRIAMADEYGADLVTVADEDGKEHQFEIIDAIETDNGRYVALLPVYDDPAETLNDDGELIILQVTEEDDGEMLVPIEDDELFDEIADIFEERLSDLYEIEEMEEEPEEAL